MASRELLELWARVESDLKRARALLPTDAAADPIIGEYQEFLDHNELELACDKLEQYGDAHTVGPAFWIALRDAAGTMSLDERASRYEARAGAK